MHFMEHWSGSLAGAIILSGLVIVFIALVILIGIVSITGRILNKDAFKPKPPAPPPPPAPSRNSAPAAPRPKGAPPAPIVQPGIAGETVAAISAAVAAMMDEQAPGAEYSLASIHRSRQQRPVWGFAGMQQNTRPF